MNIVQFYKLINSVMFSVVEVSFENLHYIPVTPNTNYKLTVNLQRINKVKVLVKLSLSSVKV